MYVFYDFETLKNCFLASFKEKVTGKFYDFVIWKEKNDLLAFVEFLKQVQGEIGYNCVKFDAQVQQWIINNVNRLILLTPDEITSEIHRYASHVVELSNARKFLDFPEWKLYTFNVGAYAGQTVQFACIVCEKKFMEYCRQCKLIHNSSKARK